MNAALQQAMQLHAQGNVDGAQAQYQALAEANPESADLQHLLGVTYFQQQQFAEARSCFEKAVVLDDSSPKHLHCLAELSLAEGDIPEAIAQFMQVVQRWPDELKARQQMMMAAQQHGAFDAVAELLKKRLKSKPKDLLAHRLQSIALVELGEYEASLKHFKTLYAQEGPNQNDQFFKGYGRALHHCGKFREALAVADEGLALYPQDPKLYVLKATCYAALKQHGEALAMYEQAYRIAPSASLRNSIAVFRFMISGMAEGFEDYYERHQLEKSVPFAFPVEEWTGQELSGKRVILWAEQGIGDIVMFLSLLPWVLQQGAEVTLAVYPKMVSLFARTFPDAEVVELHTSLLKGAEGRWDYHAAMGELMRYVLPHYTPAEHAPYLTPDPDKVAALRARYQEVAARRGAKTIIGISWYTINPDSGYIRSIPLKQWKPLFSLPGIQWVSLQYGDHLDEIAAINHKDEVLFQDPSFDAFEDTDTLVAQIAAMDRVVTIQNATAHLGGSLGVPTTLMLSAASDWRWGLERSDSLWYPSVTVTRQETTLNWPPVIQRVAKTLGDA